MRPYKDRLEKLQPYINQSNTALKLLKERYGDIDLPEYSLDAIDGTNEMAIRLKTRGGFAQQRRMIRDKRKTLDKATLYSYQAALIKHVIEGSEPVRALINPNKLKFDYDDKILSTGFENNFKPGDVFEWCNTNSYWLITLQDLDELAYFRGEIRRCTLELKWKDEDGEHSSYAAIRGPVETKINFIQKHGISIDEPNHSLQIYMPKNESTMNYFTRYAKFYLNQANSPDDKICWRVEATDSISTPGILEVVAVEYYSNTFEDDVKNGVAGALIKEPVDPTPVPDTAIVFIAGETFIKPKVEYVYTIGMSAPGKWKATEGRPVHLEPFINEENHKCVKVKWLSPQSGQFDLSFGPYKKTIVVESLF